MGSDPGDSTRLDREHLHAVRQESRALRQASQQAIARARVTRDLTLRGRPQQQRLHDSAYARLLARQETIAVIEQAKGIIMAQHRCEPEEAFDLLRRVSQRTNVKVRELAAQIVDRTVSCDDDGNVTPIRLSARMYQRPGTRARLPAGWY